MSGNRPRRRKTTRSPVRTFYPAGFNMADADKLIDFHNAKRDEQERSQGKVGASRTFNSTGRKNSRTFDSTVENNSRTFDSTVENNSRTFDSTVENNSRTREWVQRERETDTYRSDESERVTNKIELMLNYFKENASVPATSQAVEPKEEETVKVQEAVDEQKAVDIEAVDEQKAVDVEAVDEQKAVDGQKAVDVEEVVDKQKTEDVEEAVEEQLTFEAEETGDVPGSYSQWCNDELKSLNKGKSHISEQMQNICLLHGVEEDFREIELQDAPFMGSVHNALDRQHIKRLKPVQKIAWPFILKRRNFVMLSSPHSGKTLAYAAPLVHFLVEQKTYDSFPPGNGPLLLILGSGSRWVQAVQEAVTELTEPHKDVRTLAPFAASGHKSVEIDLVNGCEILITTPMYLKRLLDYDKYIMNFHRLRYLVLDEIDVLSQKFFPEVKYICEAISAALNTKHRVSKSIQIVLSGEKWCSTTEMLVKKLPSPVICITSFLEAAVYAHLQPRIYMVKEGEKLSKLFELIDDQMFRTVVACVTVEEVLLIKKAVEKEAMGQFLFIHEDMQQSEIEGCLMKWRNSIFSHVLIATDGMLREMRLKTASCLIHYSLPKKSKTAFGYRFAAVVQNLPQMAKISEDKQSLPVVHILVQQCAGRQLQGLAEFLKRLRVKVPLELKSCLKDVMREREQEKVDFPICIYTKTLGECWNQAHCAYRHVLCAEDKPRELPTSGYVKVLLSFPHTVCSFAARLLECKSKGEKSRVPNRLIDITRMLAKCFGSDHNRSFVADPMIREVYAVKCERGIFQRAQVLAYFQLDKFNQPITVYMKYLDVGTTAVVEVTKIYELPQEIKEIPAQIVELILCGLCPHDKDCNWGVQALMMVDKIVCETNEENNFVVARVKASTATTIWVDELVCFKRLPFIKSYSMVFSFRTRLLKDGLALENPSHLELLKPVLQEIGIEISEEKRESPEPEPEQKQLIVNHAFLPKEEFCPVTFITAVDPSAFFVHCAKFEDLLGKLSKKLQRLAQKKQKCIHVVAIGEYCVAKHPNGEWGRARLEKIENDTLDLFFVDYGDNADISKKDRFCSSCFDGVFAELPFQAIECELACVSPNGGQWSEDATNTFCDLASYNEDSESLELYAKVVDKKPGRRFGCIMYSVVLIDVKSNETVVLNKLMVDKGLAHQDENQKRVLEDIDLSRLADHEGSEPEEEIVDEEAVAAANDFRAVSAGADQEYEEYVDKFKAQCDFDWNNVDLEEALEVQMAALDDVLKKMMGVDIRALPEAPSDQDAEHSLDAEYTADGTADPDASLKKASDDTADYQNEMPPLVRTAYHPSVKWRQDPYFVWIEVAVPGVNNYYLRVDMMKVDFGAEMNDKIYVFNMDLFGAVDPRRVHHQGGGLCIKIKLLKLQYGIPWLRLIYATEKENWIQYDVSSIVEKKRKPLEVLLEEVRGKLDQAKVPHFEKPELTMSTSDEDSDASDKDYDERDLADGEDVFSPKVDLDMLE